MSNRWQTNQFNQLIPVYGKLNRQLTEHLLVISLSLCYEILYPKIIYLLTLSPSTTTLKLLDFSNDFQQ